MTPNEALGQLYVEARTLREEYGNLLHLVARIKSGEVQAADVQIDLASSSWKLTDTTKE